MKDLIITGETLTNTLLVMPKSNLVIADKMGAIRNKERALVGSIDENFNILNEIDRNTQCGNTGNSSGIVICSSEDLKNLGEVSHWL